MNTMNKLEEYVKDNCKAIDTDQGYREMLDECYSFKDVGVPFANMLPSRVLEECDPVAYRCGFSDWLDREDVCEIDVEYYWHDDVDKAKEELLGELERELKRELKAGEENEYKAEFGEDVTRLKAQIAEVEAYEFSK